ncbi:ABC transporter permease [Diaminobutyricimonas sp. LJ205]|uniref:ABC transporter permease n=1 Tax=Diaminobutyricimonas sp. LJ205 TaxID=2683590 RepID=UPI0012F4B392|nr:ABC transporter permease [Diaminobutyricimonas sp. LJ205]
MTDPAQERIARLDSIPFERIGPVAGSPVLGFFKSVADAWSRRELLDLLVRRELKSRYKDSSLGFLWSLIRPLVMLGIYYFAIGKVLGAERGIPQFAIFVFTGLTLWGLFNEIVTAGTSSILNNAGLIKKVYLPREIFPLAATGSALFNFGVQLVVLILATIVLGQVPWHADLLYAPLAVIVVLVFGVAFSLLLSAVTVYLRDMQYLVEVGLLIGFWISPIVYSFGFVATAFENSALPSWLLELYLANPMTVAMVAFQKAFWIAGETADPVAVYPDQLLLRLVIMIGVGMVLVWISQRVFARLQGNFAQEI